MTMTHTPTTPAGPRPPRACLPLTFMLALASCGGSTNQAAEKPAESSKTARAQARDQAKAEAEPGGEAEAAKPATPATPEGYEGYLVDTLAALASGAEPGTAETAAYGCSVKYAGEGQGEPQAKLGEPAPAFSLPNLEGEAVSLADFAGKTVVLEWFNPDCPFVKYAHGPEGPLASLAKAKQAEGVVWLAINSGAPGKQGHGVARNREAKSEWALEHPILIDEDGAVGHSYGATSTPHMFVIDPEGTLIYAGALDNAPLGRVD